MQAVRAISNRIFGNAPIVHGARSIRKLLRPGLSGEKLMAYYPAEIYHQGDELMEYRHNKMERLKRRGKGAPKKGEGKRQQRK